MGVRDPERDATDAPERPVPVSPVGGLPTAVDLPQAIGNVAFSRLVSSGGATRAPIGRAVSPLTAGARSIQRQHPVAPPAPPAAPAAALPAVAPDERYDIKLSDGEHKNVDVVTAYTLLSRAEKSLTKAYDFDFGEWALVNKERMSFVGAIGGSLTDLAGKDFPGYDENWGPAYNALVKARRELNAFRVKPAGEALQEANAAYEKAKKEWYAYKAQMDDARFKAEVGIAVVAVVAVAVIATAGAVAGAVAAGGAGGGAAGAEAAGAGAGVAGAEAAGAGAGAAGGGGGAGATAAATQPGIGGAALDAAVQAGVQDVLAAESSGGPTAVAAAAEGMEVGVLQGVLGVLIRMLRINPTSTAMGAMLYRVIQALLQVYKSKTGLGGP